jgi:hypothetical protein
LRQTRQVLIPPVVASPAPIFTKAYIDTMHMPPSRAYKYIVQACCSLSYYPEFHMLRAETARTLGDWIYEDILCRWGSLREIVTDNGLAFLKAIEYLSKRYHLNHICISGYNSRANGTVERSHFDVRQSLFKVVDGVRGHPSVSLLPLSSPTLPLSICTPYTHLCIISKDRTYSRRPPSLTVRRLPRSRLTDSRRLPASPPTRTSTASDGLRTHWDRSA